MTIGRHSDDFGDILRSAAASLFDPLAGISKYYAITVALSIRRVIRANFANWAGFSNTTVTGKRRQSPIIY